MNTKLSKKIIKEIQEKQIIPKSKIFFIIKNMLFWLFSVLSVLIGAISFSTILYNLSGNQEIINAFLLKNNISLEIFNFLPVFWIIILIIFLLLSIKNYKKTNNFYKYNLYFIFLIIIVLAFGFGSLMFSVGIGQKTEQLTQNYLPFYNKHIQIMNLKKEIFKNKLQDIGVTSQILIENPELKEKIDKKFRENVLGKTYLYSPTECPFIEYTCPENKIKFSDDLGCGCRKLYLQ